MRSRDGNKTFSLSVCSIILFHSLALCADEYLISYRYLVRDAQLYKETLSISHAMQKCTGVSTNSLILQTNNKNLKQIISLKNEKFIAYVHKLGLNVKHREKTSNFQNTSTTILTLKTTCFKVDFNDNFAKITALKTAE